MMIIWDFHRFPLLWKKYQFRPMLETKVSPSVRDRQLLVRTSNFLHISLQINV